MGILTLDFALGLTGCQADSSLRLDTCFLCGVEFSAREGSPMTETTAQKKTRLEQLAARKAEIEAALKVEKERIKRQERKARTAENAKARKTQNKLKYEYGGLCEIAGLLGVDRGTVLGLLLTGAAQIKDKPDSATAWKQKGDAMLAQREASRKKA